VDRDAVEPSAVESGAKADGASRAEGRRHVNRLGADWLTIEVGHHDTLHYDPNGSGDGLTELWGPVVTSAPHATHNKSNSNAIHGRSTVRAFRN
jgi:hypothetical protein